MRPILFNVFGFPIHSYGVMLLIAFVVATWFARKRAPKFGFKGGDVYDAAFWALILGVLGARITFIAQEWQWYSAHVNEIFTWQFAGLTSFGGVIFGVLGIYIWARRTHKSFVGILDVLAAPFLVGTAIGRVGCLLNGCCYGGLCNLPWGIHIFADPNHLYLANGQPNYLLNLAHTGPGLYNPAQIYDSLLNLAGLVVLLWIERKGLDYGKSISLALIINGAARFIYEFWRAGTVDQVKAGLATSTYMGNLPITDAQAAALAVIAIGVFMLVYLPHRQAARQRVAPVEA